MFRWLRQTLDPNGRAHQDEEPDVSGLPRVPRVGDVLAERYALTKKLGSGGAAVVFEATDLALERTVAVKIPLPQPARSEDTMVSPRALSTNLRTEAIAAMRLTHPRIARIYNYEVDGEREFLVMEFVEGKTLDDWRVGFPDARVPLSEVVRIGREVAQALAYAHAQGVVHNDIKPHNLIIDAHGAVKIVDLGIARMGRDQPGPDEPIVGTIAYLPPERVSQRPSDHRADLYALGATLYALAHGAPPFGERALRALWGHQDQPLPRSPHLSDELFAVLQRAMAKEPTDRFDDALALDRALGAVHLHRAEPDEPPPFDEEDDRLTEPLGVSHSLRPQLLAVPLPRPRPEARLPTGMAWIGPRTVEIAGRSVAVDGFWLDALCVSHEDYAAYVGATGAPPPASWPGGEMPVELADHPVTGVSWAEAAACAKWAGKRLPTTVEWTAAYRGPEGRAFPWGQHYDAEACHCAAHGATGTIPGGTRPRNRTPEGVYDLLGNVWEWTAPDPHFPPPKAGHHHALGASWRHDCQASTRTVPRTEVSLEGAHGPLGFRCARDGG